jgi:branched-chain amino acid transport system permease protein
MSQIMLGLNNGVFYATLSLGLAVIFGLLNIVNFAHGALYMLGAFVALLGYNDLGPLLGMPEFHLNYWAALIVVPLVVGLLGIVIERTMLSRLYKFDHLYGLLLTFGMALIIQGIFTNYFNVSGTPYDGKPALLEGAVNLGFMVFPSYRLWAIGISLAVCFGTWFMIERTKLGAYLRAGTEKPELVQVFGINVPLMITLTYGYGVALAAFAGVVAAPIYSVSPVMGSEMIITVFAVVVIGGMGSIMGSIVTGLALGMIEGLTKVVYPPASSTVVFLMMVLVLLVKPAGLFGKEACSHEPVPLDHPAAARPGGAVRGLPGLPDEALLFRPVRLRLQPPARLCRPALLRPCGLLRRSGIHNRLSGEKQRSDPRAGDTGRHRSGGAPGIRLRQPGNPASGNILRNDHPGPGADRLLRCPQIRLHRRRGRTPGYPARPPLRPDRPG